MGNCTVKGTTIYCSSNGTAVNCTARRGNRGRVVRVMTESCRIREYQGPMRAGDIVGRSPGYGIFRLADVLSLMPDHETLNSSQLYLLLPLAPPKRMPTTPEVGPEVVVVPGHRAHVMRGSSSEVACDLVRNLEVQPSTVKGVWRVKLVISHEQLAHILSEKANTEALIEKMRMLASTTYITAVHVRRRPGPRPALQLEPLRITA